MKLKRKDLELLMQYVEKEKPELIEINIEEMKHQTNFTFQDAESRECTVTVFSSTLNSTPNLTKTMKLYSRLKLIIPNPDGASS